MKRTISFILTLMLVAVITVIPAQSGTKPRGVTTIDGLDRWNGNLPTKGGNNFIIFEQFDRDCGPTSAEMVLHYYAKWVNQRQIWDKGGIHTIHAGTFPGEIVLALNGLGLPVDYFGGANYDALKSYIRASRPCILLLQYGLKAYHYVVVVGYDNRDRFLIADPNGHFQWWDVRTLDAAWGFRNAGDKTRSLHDLSKAFVNSIIQRKAVYTWIVPKKSPTKHYAPMWSKMLETEVTGSRRLNPFFKTEGWERTFRFSARPDHVKVMGVKPAQFRNVAGTAQAWISGSKIEGNQVKVWGRVEYGKVTRGKLWVVVRAFRYKPF